MPIEVRELVIRATVDPNANGSGAGSCGIEAGSGASKSRGAPSESSSASGGMSGSGVDSDLVQSCVREVMRILEEKRER